MKPAATHVQSRSDNRKPSGLRDYGRVWMRTGNAVDKLRHIVEHGLQIEAADEDDLEPPINDTNIDKRRHEHLTQDWRNVCILIPMFKQRMIENVEKRVVRDAICKLIHAGCSGVRIDDTNSLKSGILHWLNYDVNLPLIPPIRVDEPLKAVRGYQHPTTARLLIPMEYPANEQTYAEIKTGVKLVTADQLPRFLYPDDHVYNPEDEADMLCHGHVFIRSARHILLGPSKAIKRNNARATKGGNADRMNVTQISPRLAAYIAIQTRFALSDVQDWSMEDRDFDMRQFYWNVVEILETEAGTAILDHLNQQVFGPSAATGKRSRTGSETARVSPAERIAAQQRAKRARVGPEASGST